MRLLGLGALGVAFTLGGIAAGSAFGGDAANEPGKSAGAKTSFTFRDVGAEVGALPHLSGLRAHGAAWGDVDGDGWAELFVTAFHNAGSGPGALLHNDHGRFTLDAQPAVRTSGAGSGALFVDLTNNGRLDLYVSNCAHRANEPQLQNPGVLLKNEGGGKFTDVSKNCGAVPANFAGRGVAALDFDGDGLLDLAMCERYYGKVEKGPALFRNLGNYRFEDVSAAAGLPAGFSGLGVAAADMNADGRPDLLFTGGDGDCRLYLNAGGGKFREAPGTRDVFHWHPKSADDNPAGLAVGDVNGDALPDIVMGHHNKRPWVEPVSVRLFLHKGNKEGNPTFADVTESAGLVPLGMKAPHVEIQDFDNDGRADIYLSIVKFADGRPYPIIYKNLGTEGGLPRFAADAWAVNDFPTEQDRATRGGSKVFFDRLLSEKKIMYSAAAPSGDFDRDGRLDLLLATWFTEEHCLLLRNETPGGHWLDVAVQGADGVNRMGVGAKVRIYPAGDRAALLGAREITIGYGYCSGQEAIAHFGLGQAETVDIEVELPHGKGKFMRQGVKADQRITLAAADAPAPANGKTKAAAGAEAKTQAKSKAKPQAATRPKPFEPPYPPTLPDGKSIATDESAAFLQPSATLREGVAIAKTPPQVDFLYYPGQTYPGQPWSNWGDGTAVDGKYYSAIGDHLAIGSKGDGTNGVGNGSVFEYDSATKTLRTLCETTKVLKLPAGYYAPGKIHSRVDKGSDGWLYFATHRGAEKVTTDANHYGGDWIFRCNPQTGAAEVVVHAPVPKHAIPASVLDPDRLIFYGGTAAGVDAADKGIQFFAYDVKNKKLLYSGPDGPARYIVLARSTGRVYYTQGTAGKGTEESPLMRYDPAVDGSPVQIGSAAGIRAATEETPQGKIYVVAQPSGPGADLLLRSFDVKTEKFETLGPALVGNQGYIASLDVDPTGQYVYYVPGAHGGAEQDGSAVVQFNVKTRQRKVIAFLHPFYQEKYGAALKGTYSTAVDPQGDKLYITWNVSRGSRAWDSCALTVIHIPESERRP